jgi:hypothetical protein
VVTLTRGEGASGAARFEAWWKLGAVGKHNFGLIQHSRTRLPLRFARMPQRKARRMNGKLNVFGADIRRVRLGKGLRQNEVAVRLQLAGWDLGSDVLSLIESGQRGITDIELVMLLRALDANLADLRIPSRRSM